LSSDQGIIIARRSISLSKTYAIIGIFLACLSVLIANVPRLAGSSVTLPANSTGVARTATLQSVSFIAVPLQVFAALIFSTPVLLLFVYDKNNGVLEYLLSLGMDQSDIFRRYLKAALILASVALATETALYVIVGVITKIGSYPLFSVPALAVIIAIPVVSLTTISMMAFSSLQKQRVGSNQPLGITIGVLAVLPSYVAPIIGPGATVLIDTVLAVIVIAIALLLFFLSSKMIKREKFLP
jgi:hypothetical protein